MFPLGQSETVALGQSETVALGQSETVAPYVPRDTDALILRDGREILFKDLPRITDGPFLSLIISPAFYSKLGVLFNEPVGVAHLVSAHIEWAYWSWCQANLHFLVSEDGTPDGPVEETMIDWLQTDIVNYYEEWADIVRAQGVEPVVYNDSVFGRAIDILGIDIPTVEHPQRHSRMFM